MAQEKKPDNIVKKVFESAPSSSEKVSPLFTHFKHSAKAPVAKEAAKPGLSSKLPASIDLGTTRVKVVQLSQSAKGELEVVLMDEEAYAGAGQRKQALEKILKRSPVGSGVILGLPAKETLTFNFSFPPMSDEELKEAVRWKLKQLKPFGLELEKVKYSIVHWQSQPSTPAAQRRVTVICTPLENLTQKTALLNELGLKPLSIQASSLGPLHLKQLRAGAPSADETTMWLDLGAEESVFMVEKGGAACFVRNLSVTGMQLTRQIAQACRVHEMEAEELKKRYGLEFWAPGKESTAVSEEEKNNNPAASVFSGLSSLLENLVVDIEHSFKFFSYQVTQSQIPRFDRVMLAGGSSNLRNLENFLSDRLGVPVERANPFSSLRVQPMVRSQRRDFPSDSAVFASATGLVLSQVAAESRQVNLFVPERKTIVDVWAARAKKSPALVGALAIAAAAVFVGPEIGMMMAAKSQSEKITDKVKKARSELTSLQSNQVNLAQEEKDLSAKKFLLESKLKLFGNANQDRKPFSKILTKLASLLPEDIWVNKMTFAERKLTIVGSTSKNDLVVSFINNLKKPDDFSDVIFNYTQKDPTSSIYSFEIMMNVR